MAAIKVMYEGDFRCKTMNINGQPITTELGKEYGGSGGAYGPLELMLVSLGTCMLTVMSLAAKNQSIDLKGSRLEIESVFVPGPEHYFDTVTVRFFIAQCVDASKRKSLETIAINCPVHKNMNPQIKYKFDFNYS
jgi:uncharacterized OsmC-like protein